MDSSDGETSENQHKQYDKNLKHKSEFRKDFWQFWTKGLDPASFPCSLSFASLLVTKKTKEREPGSEVNLELTN